VPFVVSAPLVSALSVHSPPLPTLLSRTVSPFSTTAAAAADALMRHCTPSTPSSPHARPRAPPSPHTPTLLKEPTPLRPCLRVPPAPAPQQQPKRLRARRPFTTLALRCRPTTFTAPCEAISGGVHSGFQLVTNTSVFYLKNHTTTSSMIHHPSRVSGRGQKTRSVRRWRPNTGAFRPALAINARRRVFLNPPHQRSPPPFLCLGSLTSTSGVL